TLRPAAVPLAEGQRCGQDQSWRCNPTSVQTLISRPQFCGRCIDRNGTSRWAMACAPGSRPPRCFRSDIPQNEQIRAMYAPELLPQSFSLVSRSDDTNAVAPTGIPHRKNINHCTVSQINEASSLFESKCT